MVVVVVGSGSVSLEWPRRYSPGNCYLPGVLQLWLVGPSLPRPALSAGEASEVVEQVREDHKGGVRACVRGG